MEWDRWGELEILALGLDWEGFGWKVSTEEIGAITELSRGSVFVLGFERMQSGDDRTFDESHRNEEPPGFQQKVQGKMQCPPDGSWLQQPRKVHMDLGVRYQ
ncbi:hypothetical protein CK203_064971 [Vitis vinifera]|uniref:Uncharacterized protein n=1 Tax=Vitis vinifera TaxID=29760 RepID=A0A438G2U5_VITVI|nr:hypothetical protein CK203_064971 [Vitis vinifera]